MKMAFFSLKTHQMFSVHTTPGNAAIIGHFGFVSAENSGREAHDYRDFFVSEKLSFRDGLVRTVGVTVEITLRFQVSPVWFKRGLKLSNIFE